MEDKVGKILFNRFPNRCINNLFSKMIMEIGVINLRSTKKNCLNVVVGPEGIEPSILAV